MSVESQLTDKLVMVRPNFFGFNAETGLDNSFQHKIENSEEEIKNQALREFDQMVTKLQGNNLNIVVLDSPLGPQGQVTPDAIFPNNWFSTHPNQLVLYPMKAQNRRWERQPEALLNNLSGVNVIYPQTLDLTNDEEQGHILEGTGSLVLDRTNKIAYAIESQRTTETELEKWSEQMGYKPHLFHAVDFGGKPVYHTNVIMSVGEKFAVVCTPAIQSADEARKLTSSLEETGKQVINITMDQMYSMCGNILQTRNTDGQELVIMSERARSAFTSDNMKVIGKNGLVVPVNINTIETVGGGSARCMMAEIF